MNIQEFNCQNCSQLLGAVKFLKDPDLCPSDDPTLALLHIAKWLVEPSKSIPTIVEGRLCLIKGKRLNVQKIMDFAQKSFFPSLLDQFKTDSRMRLEWFFAEKSRELDALNPMSKWLIIGKNQLVPFDVSTTCSDLRESRVREQSELNEFQSVIEADKKVVIYMMNILSLAPVHACLTCDLKSELEVSGPPEVPRLHLSGTINHLFLGTEYEMDGLSSSPSSGSGRRGALSPKPSRFKEYCTNSPKKNGINPFDSPRYGYSREYVPPSPSTESDDRARIKHDSPADGDDSDSIVFL